jgi:hypothetical protein
MSAGSEMAAAAITSAYDFADCRTIVDVGGGHGRLLKGILSRFPNSRGILFDLPEVVANAHYLDEEIKAGRAEIAGGSFFDKIPGGADTYIMSGVIHDWSDVDALRILKTCRRAIAAKGRLLIATNILKAEAEPAGQGAFMDIYMMLYGGRERDEDDFRALLQDAGFSLRRIIPTPVPSIVECEPV